MVIADYPSQCKESKVPKNQITIDILYNCLLPDGGESILFQMRSSDGTVPVEIDCHC